MVRRVGFGDSDRPPKQEQRNSDQTPPARAGGPKKTTRLVVGAFMLAWLAGWSVAIAVAVDQIMAQGLGAVDAFLLIWIGVAAIFWLLAANVIWRVATGRPLSNRTRRNWGRAPRDHGGVNRGD